MRTRRLGIRDGGVGGWRLEIGEWMLVIVSGFVIFDFIYVVPKIWMPPQNTRRWAVGNEGGPIAENRF